MSNRYRNYYMAFLISRMKLSHRVAGAIHLLWTDNAGVERVWKASTLYYYPMPIVSLIDHYGIFDE